MSPLRGVVLDDYNDQPIAGAAILVRWGRQSHAVPLPGGPAEGSAVAVSDRSGRFEFFEQAVPLVFGRNTSVIMECVAPGYGVFQNYYAAAGENTVTLTARKLMSRHSCLLSEHVWYVSPPRLWELAQQANEIRAKMGLVPIDLSTGEPTEHPKVVCPPDEPPNQWGPYSGRVVDRHTERPIPGAIFVAIWIRALPMPIHAHESFEDARVAVAGADGRFELPARRPPWFSSQVENVILVCIAPGYAPVRMRNDEVHPPIAVRMRPLSAEERRRGESGNAMTGMIPDALHQKLETLANARRHDLNLQPVGLDSGELRK